MLSASELFCPFLPPLSLSLIPPSVPAFRFIFLLLRSTLPCPVRVVRKSYCLPYIWPTGNNGVSNVRREGGGGAVDDLSSKHTAEHC